MTEARFALVQEDYAQTPRKEYTARATVKGAAVEGVIAWVGKSRNRYIDIARYGIKVEGARATCSVTRPTTTLSSTCRR